MRQKTLLRSERSDCSEQARILKLGGNDRQGDTAAGAMRNTPRSAEGHVPAGSLAWSAPLFAGRQSSGAALVASARAATAHGGAQSAAPTGPLRGDRGGRHLGGHRRQVRYAAGASVCVEQQGEEFGVCGAVESAGTGARTGARRGDGACAGTHGQGGGSGTHGPERAHRVGAVGGEAGDDGTASRGCGARSSIGHSARRPDGDDASGHIRARRAGRRVDGGVEGALAGHHGTHAVAGAVEASGRGGVGGVCTGVAGVGCDGASGADAGSGAAAGAVVRHTSNDATRVRAVEHGLVAVECAGCGYRAPADHTGQCDGRWECGVAAGGGHALVVLAGWLVPRWSGRQPRRPALGVVRAAGARPTLRPLRAHAFRPARRMRVAAAAAWPTSGGGCAVERAQFVERLRRRRGRARATASQQRRSTPQAHPAPSHRPGHSASPPRLVRHRGAGVAGVARRDGRGERRRRQQHGTPRRRVVPGGAGVVGGGRGRHRGAAGARHRTHLPSSCDSGWRQRHRHRSGHGRFRPRHRALRAHRRGDVGGLGVVGRPRHHRLLQRALHRLYLAGRAGAHDQAHERASASQLHLERERPDGRRQTRARHAGLVRRPDGHHQRQRALFARSVAGAVRLGIPGGCHYVGVKHRGAGR
eukprot:ctg_321.g93